MKKLLQVVAFKGKQNINQTKLKLKRFWWSLSKDRREYIIKFISDLIVMLIISRFKN